MHLLKLLLPALMCASIVEAASDGPSRTPVKEQAEVQEKVQILPLPGRLDAVPVFNSNSPEVVQNEGILLSTCPKDGKSHPNAHLDYELKGRFDIFFHHISNAAISGDTRNLYIGLVACNPSNYKRVLHIQSAASYLSQPDAPFIKLPALSDSSVVPVYAGPGDRVMSDFLHEKFNPIWLRKIEVQDHSYAVISALSIPVKHLDPPVNGRSGLMKLHSDGPIRLACVALRAKVGDDGVEHVPELSDWIKAIEQGDLATPREAPATVPGSGEKVIYGRVAGVAIGSTWTGKLADEAGSKALNLNIGQKYAFPICTVEKGTFGTGQIQSAPLAVRYADTAYVAQGNYGVLYDLNLPLVNADAEEAIFEVRLETPFKSDKKSETLSFFDMPTSHVYFRGNVRLRYVDEQGKSVDRLLHLVQFRGQRGEPLVRLQVPSGQKRNVQFQMYYTPDSTPPQVLTVTSVPSPGSSIRAVDGQ